MLSKTILLFFFICWFGSGIAQISLTKGITVKEALLSIEKQTDYKFSYSESAIKTNDEITKSFTDASINSFLDYLYSAKNIKNIINEKQITLFTAKSNKVKFISGYVRDSETHEVLIFATVWDEVSKKGTATNEYGYYNIATNKDSALLTVSYIGYPKTSFKLNTNNDVQKDLKINALNELTEIKIIGESELSNKEGRIELNSEDYKKAPTIAGENDPLRTLSLLPGVNPSENENYIHVRGGNIGENMIMIDGVPVYKLTHFGRLSVVNGDIINKTTFYKSNFPSRYSGRTSSIIDFRVNNGNTKKLQAIGNIGFESSKLAIDGPIGKKLTFLVSGRRNYGSLFKDFIFNDNTTHSNFYDLYGKLNFTHKKGNIAISSFYDSDNKYEETEKRNFTFDSTTNTNKITSIDKLNLENKTFSAFVSAQSNFQVSENLFWNTQATYYDYAIQTKDFLFDSLRHYNNAHIQDMIFNNYFALNTKKHSYNFGVNYTYHNMFSILESDSLYYRENLDIHEANAFFEDNFQLTEKWKARLGSSISFYSFGRDLFFDFLPKLSANYQINNFSKFSSSFSRLSQNLHLLPLSFIEDTRYTSEIWQSSSKNFSPLTSNIFSLGYSNSFIQKLPFSVEAYYKYSQAEKNVLTSDLNKLFLGIESSAFNGTGHNYGLEFLLEKKGKLSGWINYTLAWSNKKFKELNNGKSYPSPYDRSHLLNVVGNYRMTKNIAVNGSWSLQSGNPFFLKFNNQQSIDSATNLTKNESQFVGFYNVKKEDLINGKYFYYPTYNEFNLQFSFHKEKKWGERIWQIGCKNFFDLRRFNNPQLTYKEGELGIFFAKKQNSLFLDVYPYVTYRFIIK